jgi:cyclopropane-fatty-acyl-phospholipid synthase
MNRGSGVERFPAVASIAVHADTTISESCRGMPEAESVAVIGAGIGGLASAYLLAKQGKKVTLFESEPQCGGHALTVDTKEFGPIDLGFQVCNLTTYPHLIGFLQTLGVDTEPSDMSFALSTPEVEWGSRDVAGMFAQPGCLRSPRFMRMWYEIVRFSNNAGEVLEDSAASKWDDVTLGDYLKKRGYSDYFAQHYVIPMCAAIWSCSDADALAWPVKSLVRFWKNHHLLDLLDRPVLHDARP